MKFFYTIFLLLFFGTNIYACSCSTPQLTPARYASISYAAVIKVKAILPFKYSGDREDLKYQVTIEETMLFKGQQAKIIAIAGAPPGGGHGVSTSCDMAMNPGEEWLIMTDAVINGVPQTGSCGLNRIYRKKDGLRDWRFKTWQLLDFMIAQHPKMELPSSLRINRDTLYYENGSPERTINVAEGKRNGLTQYYYPDGKLYGEERYLQDSLHGKQIWYARDGSMESFANYSKGHRVGTSVSYMRPNTPLYISVRSRRGETKKFQQYQGYHDKPGSYLYSETIYKRGKEFVYYYKDAQVKTLSKKLKDGTIQETSFDKSGKWTRKRFFDKNGKLLDEVAR